MITLESFAKKVAVMRSYQQEYFKLAGRARRDPKVWEDAQHALRSSKALEKEVDETVNKIKNGN